MEIAQEGTGMVTQISTAAATETRAEEDTAEADEVRRSRTMMRTMIINIPRRSWNHHRSANQGIDPPCLRSRATRIAVTAKIRMRSKGRRAAVQMGKAGAVSRQCKHQQILPGPGRKVVQHFAEQEEEQEEEADRDGIRSANNSQPDLRLLLEGSPRGSFYHFQCRLLHPDCYHCCRRQVVVLSY